MECFCLESIISKNKKIKKSATKISQNFEFHSEASAAVWSRKQLFKIYILTIQAPIIENLHIQV